jgi:trk system potassium uptake protein TrkH
MLGKLPPAARLALGLLLLVLLGTAALMLPGVSASKPLTWSEALFTSISALSVTGLSLILPGRDLTLFGQIILMVLIQLGGVGFMVMAVVILRLIGKRVTYSDRIALRDSLGLIDTRAILQFTKRILIMVLVIELTGTFLLWLHWRQSLGDAMGAFYALFHSISAFCNAGFDLFAGVNGWSGIPADGFTLMVMSMLILLGSLGMPVLFDLWDYAELRRVTLHTKLTVGMVTTLVLFGAVGFFMAETRSMGVLANEPLHRQVGLSLFHSIATRTAGYSALSNFESLTPPGQWIKMALMFIGSAPASMGGGITTGTFTVLALAMWGYVRSKEATVILGRTIPAETVRRAAAVLTLSLVLVFTATWVILVTHPYATLDQVLFEVISAFATCGFTLAFTGQLNLFGQLVIAFVMFWGRLGALTIAVALAGTPKRGVVGYPEGQVLIG